MNNENEQKVYDILKLLEIQYTKYIHKPVYTVEEANELDISMPGQHCKNLFLRNRKGDVHYLIILDDRKQVDLKFIAQEIGSTSLSFASEERLYKYLALKPGSVTPFGLINDAGKDIHVLIDEGLIHSSNIYFHPNVNTATISISYKDFERFIKWCGNRFDYVKIDGGDRNVYR